MQRSPSDHQKRVHHRSSNPRASSPQAARLLGNLRSCAESKDIHISVRCDNSGSTKPGLVPEVRAKMQVAQSNIPPSPRDRSMSPSPPIKKHSSNLDSPAKQIIAGRPSATSPRLASHSPHPLMRRVPSPSGRQGSGSYPVGSPSRPASGSYPAGSPSRPSSGSYPVGGSGHPLSSPRLRSSSPKHPLARASSGTPVRSSINSGGTAKPSPQRPPIAPQPQGNPRPIGVPTETPVLQRAHSSPPVESGTPSKDLARSSTNSGAIAKPSPQRPLVAPQPKSTSRATEVTTETPVLQRAHSSPPVESGIPSKDPSRSGTPLRSSTNNSGTATPSPQQQQPLVAPQPQTTSRPTEVPAETPVLQRAHSSPPVESSTPSKDPSKCRMLSKCVGFVKRAVSQPLHPPDTANAKTGRLGPKSYSKSPPPVRSGRTVKATSNDPCAKPCPNETFVNPLSHETPGKSMPLDTEASAKSNVFNVLTWLEGVLQPQPRSNNYHKARPPSLPSDEVPLDLVQFGDRLGHGSFGDVWKGTFEGKQVAIKKCNNVDDKNVQMLLMETSYLKKLRHPRLVSFLGCGRDKPNVFLIMEFMSGGSLSSLLFPRSSGATPTPLSFHQKTKMANQVADGLEFLHKQSVIHRDLKTANIVLDDELNCKICDFGLTVTLERTHISVSHLQGSPRYMAPEQFDSKCRLTEKVDIWQMGCVLMELFCVVLPFAKASGIAVIATELCVHKRAPTIPSSADPRARALIQACLRIQSLLRPPAKALVEALGGICGLEVCGEAARSSDSHRTIVGGTPTSHRR